MFGERDALLETVVETGRWRVCVNSFSQHEHSPHTLTGKNYPLLITLNLIKKNYPSL